MQKGGGYVICQQSASAVFKLCKDQRIQKTAPNARLKRVLGIVSRGADSLFADLTAVHPFLGRPSDVQQDNTDISTVVAWYDFIFSHHEHDSTVIRCITCCYPKP
jgi:hypothetical protein